jgi:predicted nuclease with TOPRIM domain
VTTDVERDKYVRIMSEIEELEERLDDLRPSAARGEEGAKGELDDLQNRLAERMRELARITDGCTRPGAGS